MKLDYFLNSMSPTWERSESHLLTFDLLGELDPVRVAERSAEFLALTLLEVEYLHEEVDDTLLLVKGGGRGVNVEHHLPVRGPHTLVEPKPHLSAPAQRVVVVLRGREKGTTHWRVTAQTNIIPLKQSLKVAHNITKTMARISK